jgi:quinol monooxygenase YgiN
VIIINVRFRVRPELAEQWPELTREFTEATRAEEGNLWFDWSRSLDDPNEYVLLEAFKDDAAEAHVGSDHFKKAMVDMKQWITETPRILNTVVPGEEWNSMGELQVD